MKIAFAHCWIQSWWALHVCEDLIRQIKQDKDTHITIFTSVSDRESIDIDNHKITIKTAIPKRLNNRYMYCQTKQIPILKTIFDYRNLILIAPIITAIISQQIKKYKPQKIIISSFAIAKNINTYKTPTTLYLHSPMQYIRTHYDEYTQKLGPIKWYILKIAALYLRRWDTQNRHYDKVYANSQYTAQCAKQYYNISATVKYPKVDKAYINEPATIQPQKYTVYVGRLVRFVKELDRIIKAFNNIPYPLLIIGNGPDEAYLKSIAKNNILFLGWIQDPEQRKQIVKNAYASINITKESFWLSTIESLLLGVPVIGYNQWASRELIDQQSGFLITDKEEKTIIETIEKCLQTTFDRQQIKQNALQKIQKSLSERTQRD